MPSPYRDEVVQLLQELIRADTVNPPGNETRAVEVLRAYFEASGVACELYARRPERGNLVARLPGSGDGPCLLLLSHTDTVLADSEEWTVDPWSGELKDGCVWGRGAIDMKGQAAASAVALASLAREGFRPRGDLVFAATADEEVGEGPDFAGLRWLCEVHPEAVRCDYAINEGAGDRLVFGDRVLYVCSMAEKVSSPFRLVVHGRSGHAALPGISDNALVKAAPLLERAAAFREEPRLGPETRALLEALTGRVPAAEEALEVARAVDETAVEVLEPLLGPTVSPTMITGSHKRNVIPGRCEVMVDCRLLPGDTQERVDPLIREWLGDGDYELVWREPQGGTRSPIETPLFDAIRNWVAATEPAATVAPICVAGFTDSHWLRQAFGTVAYGFFPMKEMSAELASRLVHSADERAAVADLELGVDFLRYAARRIGEL